MALVDSYTMLCQPTKRHLTKSEHFRNGPKGLERKIIICINTMHSWAFDEGYIWKQSLELKMPDVYGP